MNEEICRSDN